MPTTAAAWPAQLADLPVPGIPGSRLASMADRLTDGSLPGFLDQLHRVRACLHPIRLFGHVDRVNPTTGELTRDFDTAGSPDGVLLIPCGNRRASRCPSCSDLYAGDAWQIVTAGLVGGLGLPDTVGTHPGLFVTVTAPSFGRVHTRDKTAVVRTCTPRRGACPHGRTAGCFARHEADDVRLGEPLCGDCYDYPGQVVWNAACARLWKRTCDLTRRRLAHLLGLSERRCRELVRVTYLKVAEMQGRGAVHFHAVFRLDAASKDPSVYLPPPERVTGQLLAAALRWAVPRAEWPCPDPRTPGLEALARWGSQLDVRQLELAGGELDFGAVAGYLAKYVTKSVLEGGALDQRIRTAEQLADMLPRLRPHPRHLVETAWRLGRRTDCAGLRHWAHSYGYGGHWLTKSRSYSTTFGERRRVRRTWRRRQDWTDQRAALGLDDQVLDEEEPVLTGSWRFEGTGYRSTADRELALQAADQARSRREDTRAAVRAARTQLPQ
jgi:hypothetical protein